MTDHTKTYKVWEDLQDNGNLLHVTSLDKQGLAIMFGLDIGSATLLHMLIEDETNDSPHWDKYDPALLHEVLGEAEHQSYDGWSDSDKVVIMSFMADIGKALENM